ncbi:MAG: PP0621 family protein [Gammaproteobacteria bacterium]|nr:PP0621 family protein [Gammaproteobacteria bacterium]
MRTLLIFIALALIYMIGKRLWLQSRRRPPGNRELTGKMVQCANCGIFIPQQEALEQDGHYYCSREHRDESKRQS